MFVSSFSYNSAVASSNIGASVYSTDVLPQLRQPKYSIEAAKNCKKWIFCLVEVYHNSTKRNNFRSLKVHNGALATAITPSQFNFWTMKVCNTNQ